MTWLQLTVMLCCVFAFGLFWGIEIGRKLQRYAAAAKARRKAVADHDPLRGQQQIVVPRTLAHLDITMAGQTIRSDLTISGDLLEHLANGLGKTMIPLPSKAMN